MRERKRKKGKKNIYPWGSWRLRLSTLVTQLYTNGAYRNGKEKEREGERKRQRNNAFHLQITSHSVAVYTERNCGCVLLWGTDCKCFLSHNWFVVRLCLCMTLWTTFGFLCTFVWSSSSLLFFCAGQPNQRERGLDLWKLITTQNIEIRFYKWHIDNSVLLLVFFPFLLSLFPLFRATERREL